MIGYPVAVAVYALFLAYLAYSCIDLAMQGKLRIPPEGPLALILFCVGTAVPLYLVFSRWLAALRRGHPLVPREYRAARRVGRYAGTGLVWIGHYLAVEAAYTSYVTAVTGGERVIFLLVSLVGALLAYTLSILTIEISIRRWHSRDKPPHPDTNAP